MRELHCLYLSPYERLRSVCVTIVLELVPRLFAFCLDTCGVCCMRVWHACMSVCVCAASCPGTLPPTIDRPNKP